MKKLGILFGATLWLDTNNENIGKMAEKVLGEMFEKRYATKTDAELDQEVLEALGRKPYEREKQERESDKVS